jgi:hypothetical protein
MNRESVYLGCVILMMAAISAVSAQDGAAAINSSIMSGAATSNNASLNDTSDESEPADEQADISAENKTAAESNISIPATNNAFLMPSKIALGSKNTVASFNRPAFIIGGGGEKMMQRASEVRLPAETVMHLSGAINIESSKEPFDIGSGGNELLQLASDKKLPAETIMDLSATVLPRYKIRNIN